MFIPVPAFADYFITISIILTLFILSNLFDKDYTGISYIYIYIYIVLKTHIFCKIFRSLIKSKKTLNKNQHCN